MSKDGFDLMRCPTCRLLMREMLPLEDDLPEIYAADYFRHEGGVAANGYADYIRDAQLHGSTARRRLAWIARYAASKGRLLDVGAAAGFFVREANDSGWTAEGIDIAAPMVAWGRSTLKVSLNVATLESFETEGGFAAITMWDYIEHSLDPWRELSKCWELLRPGGIVALSTGDIDSIAARLTGSRWHLLTPRHHNFFFSSTTIRRLLDRCGFQLCWLGHPGANYSVAHMIYKLEQPLDRRGNGGLARRLVSHPIGRVAVPLNLFDIVTVIARRSA
jgi:SAM-dependent methyltransferase